MNFQKFTFCRFSCILVRLKHRMTTKQYNSVKHKIKIFVFSILADLMCFLNLTLHSQTSAFLDHIVIRKNLELVRPLVTKIFFRLNRLGITP